MATQPEDREGTSMGFARSWYTSARVPVESNANWADGASREGPSCSWASSHSFWVRHVEVPNYTWEQRWGVQVTNSGKTLHPWDRVPQ